MTESFIIRYLLSLYYTIDDFYEESFTARIFDWLWQASEGSLICSFFSKLFTNKPLEYEGLFTRIISAVWDFLFGIWKKITVFVVGSLSQSLIWRGLTGFARFLWVGILADFVNWVVGYIGVAQVPLYAYFIIMAIVPHSLWNNYYILLATVFFAIYYLVYSSLHPAQGRSTAPKLPPASLMAYILVVGLSITRSFAISDSLRVTVIFLACVGLAIVVRYAVRSYDVFNMLMSALIIGMFLTSLYALYQYRFGVEIRSEFIDLSASSGMPGRIYSTMDNPNNYAEYLILILPLSVAYILNLKNDISRLIYTCMVAVSTLSLVLTLSRASYIAFVLAIFVFILIVRPRLIPFFVLLGIMLIPFIPSTIINRLMTIGRDTSSSYRLFIWEGVLRMLKSHWLYGIGMGPEGFGIIYKGMGNIQAFNAMHSHNLVFQIALETGIFGLISFVVFVFGTFKRCLIIALKGPSKQHSYYAAAFCATIVAFMFFAMVEYVWYYPRVTLTFWIVIGLAMGFVNLQALRVEYTNKQ